MITSLRDPSQAGSGYELDMASSELVFLRGYGHDKSIQDLASQYPTQSGRDAERPQERCTKCFRITMGDSFVQQCLTMLPLR